MGRKSKLTPELQEKILLFLKAGNYVNTACLACGIDETTFYNWIKWGKKRKAGIYFKFFQSTKRAEAEAEARLVTLVNLAGPNNWQAAMTMLERKYPERWGRKDRTAVDVTSKGKAIKTYVGISPDDWDIIQARKDKEQGKDASTEGAND